MKVIRPDGKITIKKKLSFAQAQKLVEGYVEVVHLSSGCLLVNEDGLSQGLITNMQASSIAKRPIVGTCILLETKAEIKQVMGT